jgi:hypothetical protein
MRRKDEPQRSQRARRKDREKIIQRCSRKQRMQRQQRNESQERDSPTARLRHSGHNRTVPAMIAPPRRQDLCGLCLLRWLKMPFLPTAVLSRLLGLSLGALRGLCGSIFFPGLRFSTSIVGHTLASRYRFRSSGTGTRRTGKAPNTPRWKGGSPLPRVGDSLPASRALHWQATRPPRSPVTSGRWMMRTWTPLVFVLLAVGPAVAAIS